MRVLYVPWPTTPANLPVFGNPPCPVDDRPVLVRAYLAFELAPVAAAIRTFIHVVDPLLAIAANDIGDPPVRDPSGIPIRVG
jgi:hypothetical protein